MSNIPKKEQFKKFITDNRGIISLPIKIEQNEAIWSVLNERWDKFLELVKKTSWLSELQNNIEKEIQAINNAISSYYSNNVTLAKKSVQKAINISSSTDSSYLIGHLNKFLAETEYDEWYRVRVGGLFPFSHDEMFHIPFSKRAIVKNERYSINGIPCLYLGNSLYVCWEEMQRPAIDSLSVSRYSFKQVENFKVLNLAFTVGDLMEDFVINENLFPYEKNVFTFFNAWILQSACSIIIDNEKRLFHEEYVVPQLIMQCLDNFKLDGVLYFSNRVDEVYFSDKSWICKNLAIPAVDHTLTKDVYSQKIKNVFNWTYPINVGLWRANLHPKQSLLNFRMLSAARKYANICSDDGKNTLPYKDSIFYNIESELYSMEHDYKSEHEKSEDS